jgi:glycosyltransferase involved in cell wall biosynthesis
VRFLRLGTLEARKQPVEILNGFREAIAQGANAELVFIGKPSASDQAINDTIAAAIDEGLPVTWIKHADDALVYDELHRADVFLSIGIEGYGIPVLEAIRVGTPVLYDGIQPAGELMEAQGARRIDAGSNAALANTFVEFSSESRQESLIAELSSATTPEWNSFASTVAHTAAQR